MKQEKDEFFILPDDPPSKRAILSAAFKLFVRDGFDATNIRAIGKEAGYSNPAMFKFFDSKEQLALYLFERCYLRFADSIEIAIQPGHSFKQNLDTTLDNFCVLFDESPGAFLFVQDHLRHFWPHVSSHTRKRSILGQLQSLIEQGIDEKIIKTDIDPKMLVAAFVGFVTQYARMHYFGEFKGGVNSWKSQLKTVSHRILVG